MIRLILTAILVYGAYGLAYAGVLNLLCNFMLFQNYILDTIAKIILLATTINYFNLKAHEVFEYLLPKQK